MRIFFLIAVCCVFCGGSAEAGAPPHVILKIQQRILAGLPVWLDVVADDPCIGVHYWGDPSGYTEGGWVEIRGPGDKAAGPGFRPWIPVRRGSVLQRWGTCPSSTPLTGDGTHRIPLHLIADIRVPGAYAVRWHIPETTELGALAATDWVAFTMTPSTGEQREAWLTDLLAHQPSDPEVLWNSYVPSLMAALDNPRAIRRLLELLCRNDRQSRLSKVFGPALSQDAQIYLAALITKGCLSEQLVQYFGETTYADALGYPKHPEQRRRLLLAVVQALPKAESTDLAHGLSMLISLRHGQHDALAAVADAAVMRVVPKILVDKSAPDSSEDNPKWKLVEYMGDASSREGANGVLRALAAQENEDASHAIAQLILLGDPANLPYLQKRLRSGVNGVDSEELMRQFKFIPKRFGAAGNELLHALLSAHTAQVRAVAAVVLAVQEDDRTGMKAIITALRSNHPEDETELLNELQGAPACPIDVDQCGEIIVRDDQLPALAPRRAAMIAYFENKLGATK